VASRIKGLEFIDVEGGGRLIEPEDVVSLKRTLDELIQSPKERIGMGMKGLHLARERFSWDSRVSEIEELIRKLE